MLWHGVMWHGVTWSIMVPCGVVHRTAPHHTALSHPTPHHPTPPHPTPPHPTWTAMGADPRWGLSALQRVPQGLAVSGPALHKALGWRYGAAAPLWRSPRLHWRDGAQPSLVAPLLAPLWDLGPLPVRRGGAATPQAWTSAPQRRVLLIERWDSEEEGSGGHWVGVHNGRPVPLPGQRVPRRAPGPACGHRRGAGLDPEGVRPVVCGVARPGVAPAAPAAPVPRRRGRHHHVGVARGPRARAGVAAAPQGAGRFSRALTQVCGHRAAVR